MEENAKHEFGGDCRQESRLDLNNNLNPQLLMIRTIRSFNLLFLNMVHYLFIFNELNKK